MLHVCYIKMRHVSKNNGFEFQFLFSTNPSLKWIIFGFKFEYQLSLYNASQARCGELISVGCLAMELLDVKGFSAKSKLNIFEYNFVVCFIYPSICLFVH